MLAALKKLVWGYLVSVGLLAHVLLVFGVIFALSYFHLTPSQLLYKVAEKSGVTAPWLLEAVSPAKRFSDHVTDGYTRAAHPRILLPGLAGWDGIGEPALMLQRVSRYRTLGMIDFDPCKSGGDVVNLTACWVSSGDPAIANRLRTALKDFHLETPDVQARYGNAWQLALGYDVLSLSPDFDADDRALIESKIEYALREYLRLLDDPSPSLWHGRTTLASMAWLCAIVLEPTDERLGLFSRAQGHFLDVIRAVELTEGWPEGYNYWIQNRGFIFTLAASAYLNGLEGSANHERIRKLLRRVGLWHIYATRPDNRIEGLGDEGSRVDLKDETRRVIDIIAQATQDPLFATFSRYVEKLHGRASYYRDYRWGFRLFNDPFLADAADVGRDLTAFQGLLPQAEIFGRGGLNLAYIHSDWSPEETFISFRAGQTFTHHGHYDAGHFSLFKREPLAINSSTYGGGYTKPHRLNYAIRTVAKNSLLILRPGEEVNPNRFFSPNVSDGGQRVIIPTGSSVRGVTDWAAERKRGTYYGGGQIDSFDYKRNQFTYISSDLTKAYNTPEHDEGGRDGKVREVRRQLVYLFDDDRLIVRDTVVATDASYTKKWLLHTVNRPELSEERVLKGSRRNGISESSVAVATVKNGDGFLRIDRLYPEDAVIRLVGGPDYQFYVESDGDDSDLDGENFSDGVSLSPWYDVGMWRMEIQPGKPRLKDEFLIVLSPGHRGVSQDKVRAVELGGTATKAVQAGNYLVVFLANEAHGTLQVPAITNAKRLLVVGIPPHMDVRSRHQSGARVGRSSAEGTFLLEMAQGDGAVSLAW